MASPANAQLKEGQAAPTFSAQAALGGKLFNFELSEALEAGPVVLYFFPKAFTSGCTIEAQLFAENSASFKQLNATVIGVSGDDIQTLQRFSEGPCGGKFAVAADSSRDIMAAYKASQRIQSGIADRISYVIAPDSSILSVIANASPVVHVQSALQTLQAWSAQPAAIKR